MINNKNVLTLKQYIRLITKNIKKRENSMINENNFNDGSSESHANEQDVILLFQWGDYDDQIPRNILKLGICIPESCTAIDLQTSLQRELDKVFNPEQARVAVKVDPLLCTVGRDIYPFDTGFFVTR